jgi:hypothetical protein
MCAAFFRPYVKRTRLFLLFFFSHGRRKLVAAGPLFPLAKSLCSEIASACRSRGSCSLERRGSNPALCFWFLWSKVLWVSVHYRWLGSARHVSQGQASVIACRGGASFMSVHRTRVRVKVPTGGFNSWSTARNTQALGLQYVWMVSCQAQRECPPPWMQAFLQMKSA